MTPSRERNPEGSGGPPRFEVENKFPVGDVPRLVERLSELGARFDPEVGQVDLYFSHPARDFASTGEALRMRCVGEENRLTYKGPKIDDATRTRREIELPVGSGDREAAEWNVLLEVLGFTRLTEVRKRRRSFDVVWQGRRVTGALDEVDALGSFVELEIVVEQTDLSEAQRVVVDLAGELELGPPERQSYPELLLD